MINTKYWDIVYLKNAIVLVRDSTESPGHDRYCFEPERRHLYELVSSAWANLTGESRATCPWNEGAVAHLWISARKRGD